MIFVCALTILCCICMHVDFDYAGNERETSIECE